MFDCRPAVIDFSTQYVGSLLYGCCAIDTEAQQIDITQNTLVSENGNATGKYYSSDLFVFDDPCFSRQYKKFSVFYFKVRTDSIGDYVCWLSFRTADSCTKMQGRICLRETTRKDDVLLCPSLFHYQIPESWQENTARAISSLNRRVHYVNRHREKIEIATIKTIVLSSIDLLETTRDEVDEYVQRGCRIVIFASDAVKDTVEAANGLMQPYGIRMEHGDMRRLNIVCDYCGMGSGSPHRKQVLLHTSNNLVIDDELWRPLITYDGKIACAQRSTRTGGAIVIVCHSSYSGFASIGWPFCNAESFAMML